MYNSLCSTIDLSNPNLDLSLSGGSNGGARARNQEIARLDSSVGTTRSLQLGGIGALEGRVAPGTGVPRVARSRHGADEGDLAARVGDGGIALHGRLGAAHVEADVAVLPGRVAGEGESARVAVVDEALLQVAKSDAVLHNVVGGWVVGDAQLEAVAVALKGREAPSVDAVAPSVDLLERDGRRKHVEVQAVVDVLVEPGVAQDVARAGARLAGEAVGALAVLAGVAVAVRVEVLDRVVGRGTLELEASLVVVVGGEALVVVVGCITGIDAVRSIDQPGILVNH